MSRVVADLEEARKIESKNREVESSNKNADAVKHTGMVVQVDETQVLKTLAQARQIMHKLSKALSDSLEVSQEASRQHRQLQNFWTDHVEPLNQQNEHVFLGDASTQGLTE